MGKVVFTEGPAPDRTQVRAALRRQLAPGRVAANPAGALRAAACSGLRLGARPYQLVTELQTLGAGTPLAPLVDHRASLLAVIRSCAQLLASNSDTSAVGILKRRLSISQRLVGHLLTPASAVQQAVAAGKRDVKAGRAREVGEAIVVSKSLVSKSLEVNARLAVAVLGAAALQDAEGRDTVLATADWVGVQANLTTSSALRALRAAVQLGWLTQLAPTAVGRVPRYRISRLRERERDVAVAFPGTINSLAMHADEDPLAAMIASVDSALWAYGSAWDGARGWVSTLSSLAGADDLGVGGTKRRKLTRTVATELAAQGVADIHDYLPVEAARAAAITSGADLLRSEMQAAADRRRADRQEKMVAFRAQRARARVLEKAVDAQLLTSLRRQAGSLPRTREELQLWIAPAAEWAASVILTLDGEVVATFRRQLRWKLVRHLSGALADWTLDTLLAAQAPAQPKQAA